MAGAVPSTLCRLCSFIVTASVHGIPTTGLRRGGHRCSTAEVRAGAGLGLVHQRQDELVAPKTEWLPARCAVGEEPLAQLLLQRRRRVATQLRGFVEQQDRTVLVLVRLERRLDFLER